MSEAIWKSLASPDEVTTGTDMVVEIVEFGDLTVARSTLQPGWRWSTHMKPMVGGDLCQARHVGVLLSGRMALQFADGRTIEVGPDVVYHFPPGHDGYVVGDEPAVAIEWSGVRPWLGGTSRARLLTTLVFTDLVESTERLREMGDAAWRETLSSFFEGSRAALDKNGGIEIKTTGDGMLAMFDAPAQALACAAEIRRVAEREGLRARTGVHVGEVEQVGKDVRGSTVHETARIMSAAGPGEIFVSEITRALATGMRFEERGEFDLKGFDAAARLFAYVT